MNIWSYNQSPTSPGLLSLLLWAYLAFGPCLILGQTSIDLVPRKINDYTLEVQVYDSKQRYDIGKYNFKHKYNFIYTPSSDSYEANKELIIRDFDTEEVFLDFRFELNNKAIKAVNLGTLYLNGSPVDSRSLTPISIKWPEFSREFNRTGMFRIKIVFILKDLAMTKFVADLVLIPPKLIISQPIPNGDITYEFIKGDGKTRLEPGYAIQLGYYDVRPNMEAFKKLDIKAVIYLVRNENQYTARAGTFVDRREAETLLRVIQQYEEFQKAYIVDERNQVSAFQGRGDKEPDKSTIIGNSSQPAQQQGNPGNELWNMNLEEQENVATSIEFTPKEGSLGTSTSADLVFIQLAAFSQAPDYVEFISHNDYPLWVYSTNGLNKIMAGPFVDKKEAGKHINIFRERGLLSPFITFLSKNVELTAMESAAELHAYDYLAARGSSPNLETHTVRKGDTLSAIARLYGVKLDDLIRINKIKNPHLIRSGQIIRLR